MTPPLDDVRAALEKLDELDAEIKDYARVRDHAEVVALEFEKEAPILTLRNAAPALLAQIAELKAENERLRAAAAMLWMESGSKQTGTECVAKAFDWHRAALAKARALAFEKAAKVADTRAAELRELGAVTNEHEEINLRDATADQCETAVDIAAAIRALAERKEIGS